jgi:hypothetical protein
MVSACPLSQKLRELMSSEEMAKHCQVSTFCFWLDCALSLAEFNTNGGVIAVHHYFERAFIQHTIDHDGAKHPDLWTLNYLSRVICTYHCNCVCSTR